MKRLNLGKEEIPHLLSRREILEEEKRQGLKLVRRLIEECRRYEVWQVAAWQEGA